jgi:catechol 2,3-dioxygenase-like lactoylglutathione lyase family enzyme
MTLEDDSLEDGVHELTIGKISHVSITVTELGRSRAWYSHVLGWEERSTGRSPTTSYAYGQLPGGLSVVLRQHDHPLGDRFDERRPGLDHLSFIVTSDSDLRELEKRLHAVGALADPIQAIGSTTKILTFRDPDNIALEAFLAG